MPTYPALAADYLLRRLVGVSSPSQAELHQLMQRVVARQTNHVIESEELNFSLLMAYNVIPAVTGKSQHPLERCFVYTKYGAHARRPVTQQDVIQELTTLGVASPSEYLEHIAVGETLVFYWSHELCIALQRLEQVGRWARRNFPLTYFGYVGLADFNYGIRKGLTHAMPAPYIDDGAPLPFMQTS